MSGVAVSVLAPASNRALATPKMEFAANNSGLLGCTQFDYGVQEV